MEYTLPTIHLNGTGARSLVTEYRAAAVALQTAREALQAATCHPRDFYPQGEEAYYQARLERDHQIARLNDVLAYLEAWQAQALDSPLYR